eukprot:jgi/Botrbrau1/5564/Bobra.0023s0047.1
MIARLRTLNLQPGTPCNISEASTVDHAIRQNTTNSPSLTSGLNWLLPPESLITLGDFLLQIQFTVGDFLLQIQFTVHKSTHLKSFVASLKAPSSTLFQSHILLVFPPLPPPELIRSRDAPHAIPTLTNVLLAVVTKG